MKKIGVIGTGTMGIGIAQVFIENGYDVYIKSIRGNGSNAKLSIQDNFEKLKDKGKISIDQLKEYIDKINVIDDDCYLSDCDIIIEATREDIEVKKDIFRYLDIVCDEKTIFATNTSSLSITEIATCTNRSDKVIGIHFFNPATRMVLVEVIKGLQTAEYIMDMVKELIVSINKQSVEVNEAPGFIVNRMLIPMINEAICILAEGVATAEDIDRAMELGANHPMGPLKLGDLIGLDICLNIMDVLYNETGDTKYRANSLLRKYVRVGWLGRKSGRGFYEYNIL